MKTKDDSFSFLKALGVASRETEINGVKGTVYELNTQQVAILLERVGSLIAVVLLLRDLFTAGPAGYQGLFDEASAKLSKEARETLYRLVAFSLKSSEESVQEIAPRHLPALLLAICEVNQDFFDLFSGTSPLRQQLATRFPGLAGALNNLAADGSPSSPASGAEDGASAKSA